MDEKKRLIWFILVRVVVVSLFLASTIILNTKEPASLVGSALYGFIKLIIATYIFSIISLIFLKWSERFNSTLAYAQIIWDLLLVTLLILLTGGITSPYSFLYTLSIINASVLLSRREAIYTASLCAILYGAILDFQFYGKLTFLGLSQLPALQFEAPQIFYTIFVNIVAFYLTAFLTGYLAERVRRSESALQEKVIDYEELERLNSSIVYNLDSGLLTLNNEGKIRVFNRYAVELTGISQVDAYDRMLAEVIPGFHGIADQLFSLQRGEIEFQPVTGGTMTFGYKTVPFDDSEGRRSGVIIDFQDLTRLKRMEVKLKKADRLAAVGELSARIAHEIRNPLAAISGSVQIIAQGDNTGIQDKKLREIVVRETDRLNTLISDFLNYARPNQPMKEPVELKRFIAELTPLLHSDPRFEKVEIRNECPPGITVGVDRDQFKQVFWNLLVNAAEAATAQMVIVINACELHDDEYEINLGNVVKIVVSDNGKGMSEDKVKRVFEPFFTTKPRGTGLGLATVYRIIESHGGVILVDSEEGKGTTFTLFLPLS